MNKRGVIRTKIGTRKTKKYDRLSDVEDDGFSKGRVSVACKNNTKYRGFWWNYDTPKLYEIEDRIREIDRMVEKLQSERDSLISEYAVKTSAKEN